MTYAFVYSNTDKEDKRTHNNLNKISICRHCIVFIRLKKKTYLKEQLVSDEVSEILNTDIQKNKQNGNQLAK